MRCDAREGVCTEQGVFNTLLQPPLKWKLSMSLIFEADLLQVASVSASAWKRARTVVIPFHGNLELKCTAFPLANSPLSGPVLANSKMQ